MLTPVLHCTPWLCVVSVVSCRELVEYKYVVLNADGTVDRWQPGGNLGMEVPVAQVGMAGRKRVEVLLGLLTDCRGFTRCTRACCRLVCAGAGAGCWVVTERVCSAVCLDRIAGQQRQAPGCLGP